MMAEMSVPAGMTEGSFVLDNVSDTNLNINCSAVVSPSIFLNEESEREC